MSDELEFRVSSGLKDIIGRDLITDDFIAVFELVKNSYDAHAKNVVITIEDDKIIIADNGKGMSLNDLKEKWLFVAYSAKKDGTEDEIDDEDKNESYRDIIQEKRHYAGAKGIGRFSSDRLGRFLTISTQKEDSKQIEQIIVDWKKFEKNPKDLFQKIKVNHQSIKQSEPSFPNKSKHGTRLEISSLFEKWNRPRLKNLKHSLEKLINPFSEVNDFTIDIICKREHDEDNIKDKEDNFIHIERDRINGPVKNSILQLLKIKTTQISVIVNSQFIETRIVDRGTPIYHIKEENIEFPLLTDLRITLYFLNTSAKNNFTRNMGVRVVNFGSVFLFKNGFRVQPFGEFGDDSWELDQRKQQGYNRTLGTRDLLGSVELVTDDSEQFKEVSSRDGGLVESAGSFQLMKFVKEKGLLRLERYVVGVLWGEGFRKKKYFGEGDEANKRAESIRKELQEKDKESEDVSIASSNLGSKIDFIQIVKSLASNKNVEIINFNKDFVDLVNERLDEHQTRFISDLETIADQTNDTDLRSKILLAEKKYQELKKEKEAAEKRAEEEEGKRKEAEEKAEKEAAARIAAEKKQKEEEDKRRAAELDALRKENERLRAVEERRKEEERRKKAEQSLENEKDKSAYLSATRKTLSDDAEELVHSIKVSAIGIDEGLEKILRRLRSEKSADKSLYEEIGRIKFITDKVMKLSMLITKSNFKADQEVRKVKIALFIKEYIDTYSYAYTDKIKITVYGKSDFISRVSVLDLTIVLDNLISNSHKAKAKNIILEIKDSTKGLDIFIHDDGNGVPNEFLTTPKAIFELGVKSNIEGSGIGLYTVKKKMVENLHGAIAFVGNGVKLKGATFKLSFD